MGRVQVRVWLLVSVGSCIGGDNASSHPQDTNYYGTSHFPCCITNFPQGWPKFAQSTILWRPDPAAIVVASLVPVVATVRQAGNATVAVDSAYPFGDTAKIAVTADGAVTVAVRIPGWATAATVDGKPAANGTLVSIRCAAGSTTIAVDLAPTVRVERGWGNTVERSPPADAVAASS